MKKCLSRKMDVLAQLSMTTGDWVDEDEVSVFAVGRFSFADV